MQAASVTFFFGQWMLIILTVHCTNVQTAVFQDKPVIISIFHLKATIIANKDEAIRHPCGVLGTLTGTYAKLRMKKVAKVSAKFSFGNK